MSAVALANRIHVKSSTEEIGQKEQDANTALLNLDKGLRSADIGEQCEAIVLYPTLFEKYPFPILINSAFMRLADTYRGGNNFIRLCILKVVQESAKHLEKILNVTDLSKTTSSVMHSNDPLARAITLRTLGSLASILSEQTNIHHIVMVALDSHDAAEVKAAIFAADYFSKQSRAFSLSICEKLGSIIEQLSTPLDVKIKIVSILRHMHHDIHVAEKARSICHMLLDNYPSREFVEITLHTMSALSVEAVFQTRRQIELLLTYVESDDAKQPVKLIAIKDLRMISARAPHLWVAEHGKRLFTFLSATQSARLANRVLDVLLCLSGQFCTTAVTVSPDTPDYQVLFGLCYHEYQLVASKAILLLARLATRMESESKDSALCDVITALQTAIVCETQSTDQTLTSLKKCLQCVTLVCASVTQLESGLLEMVMWLLRSVDGSKQDLVAECLAGIGHVDASLLEPLLPQIVDVLEGASHESDKMRIFLCDTILQLGERSTVPTDARDLLVKTTLSMDHWSAWKIVRQAMRYSQFAAAFDIVSNLRNLVSTEQFYYWLTAILHICDGESTMHKVSGSNEIEMAMQNIYCHERAISAFRAASMQSANIDFQIEYVRLRCHLLRLHCQLLMACSTFRKCPPPAITAALATSSTQDVTHSSQFVREVETCSEEYSKLQSSIADLYRSCFDADDSSLENINTLQEVCDCMVSSIASILRNKAAVCDSWKLLMRGNTEQCRKTIGFMKSIAEEIREIITISQSGALTYRHVSALSSAASRLMLTRLGYPRFFFHKQQSTSIKLAISPQSSETLSVSCSTQLTVKVEGVIHLGPRPGLYRRVCALNIYVESNLVSKAPSTGNTKAEEKTTNSLKQTTEPNNDYFITNFLLSLPVVGRHCVRVKVTVVDENRNEWKIGPRKEFWVKSIDDGPVHQSNRPT